MSRYELLERIGAGGMAEIFRGVAIAAGGFEKPVAIKRILPHLSEDKRFVELLISEAKILSQLRHRNIVQIFDVGLGEDGQYFLVMEFVDGTDLAELFDLLVSRGERIPLDVSLHIAAEVCEALDHAHRATDSEGQTIRLVHRDVSPSNVLLSISGEAKLTDFGIAKSIEEATGHGGVRGKFAYISPEQARNIHIDGRSDAYSLGIILHELLTGRRLFSALSDFDALTAVREPRIPPLRAVDPSLPAELEAIVARALDPEPDRRYEDAAALGRALRTFRYSLDETSGDPAKAISNLVREVWKEVEVEDDERTVMRSLPGGKSNLAGAPAAADFDDEETRAISILGTETRTITLRSSVSLVDQAGEPRRPPQQSMEPARTASGRAGYERAGSRPAPPRFGSQGGRAGSQGAARRSTASPSSTATTRRIDVDGAPMDDLATVADPQPLGARAAEAIERARATRNLQQGPPPGGGLPAPVMKQPNAGAPPRPRGVRGPHGPGAAAHPAQHRGGAGRSGGPPPGYHRGHPGMMSTSKEQPLPFSGQRLGAPRRSGTAVPARSARSWRIILVMAVVAAVIAIAAFIVAGQLLSDDEGGSEDGAAAGETAVPAPTADSLLPDAKGGGDKADGPDDSSGE